MATTDGLMRRTNSGNCSCCAAARGAARRRKARVENRAFTRLGVKADKRFPSQIILISARVKESPHDSQPYDQPQPVPVAHRPHLPWGEMHPPASQLFGVLEGEEES